LHGTALRFREQRAMLSGQALEMLAATVATDCSVAMAALGTFRRGRRFYGCCHYVGKRHSLGAILEDAGRSSRMRVD